MAKTRYPISFIVPALNEEKVIESVVRSIWSVVDENVETFEIILIDDGSTDRTGDLMDALSSELRHVRVLHNKPNIGLGASYKRGIQEAKLEYVMMLCGDGGLPAASLPPILEKVGSADIVVPYMTNLRQIKTPSRYFISRFYTRILNLISGHHIHYYNGLPVHRRIFVNSLRVTTSGFGFQGQILVKLLKSGCSYVQVPTLGAEATNKTSVFRPKNLISVIKTLVKLIFELATYKGDALRNETPLSKTVQRNPAKN